MNKNFVIIALMTIFLLALITRLYRLGIHPLGFFCDEAATGFNAYQIAVTGHDEYEAKLPVLFRSFGNYRPGLPVYLTAAFVKTLGLSEFSTRLPVALIGSLTIFAIYGLSKQLFNSSLTGLLSSLFLAISPWHIQFSRYADGHIILVFFLTVGLWLFLKGLKDKRFLLINFFYLALALYTYFPAYFLIPLIMFAAGIIFFKKLLLIKKVLVIPIIVFVITAMPLAWQLTNRESLARFRQVSSANYGKTKPAIFKQMLITYKDHFSPNFLFFKGDIGYPTHFISRFSVRGLGQLYLFQLPLILIGLTHLFNKKQSGYLLLAWLLIYPLGSTVVPFADGGGPFATRSIIGVVPWQILTSLGATKLFKVIPFKKMRLFLAVCLSALTLFSFGYYLRLYFIQYPLYSSDFWGWQYGPREIVGYFETVHQNYDQLFMSGSFNAPYIFLRFYSPDDCQNCFIGGSEKFDPLRRQLFALKPEEITLKPDEIIVHKNIYYPNNQLAFIIFELKK